MPQNKTPLQDYPDRSVQTTWTISYEAIKEQDKATANLLLLWSFLDNKNIWHGLFAAACSASTRVASELSAWFGDISSNELEFARAMQLLRNYSLVEAVEDVASYTAHPVIHKWAYHYRGQDFPENLARLAVLSVGWAVPDVSTRDYSTLQRRLLPHAEACLQWVAEKGPGRSSHDYECDLGGDGKEEREVILGAAAFDASTKKEKQQSRASRRTSLRLI